VFEDDVSGLRRTAERLGGVVMLSKQTTGGLEVESLHLTVSWQMRREASLESVVGNLGPTNIISQQKGREDEVIPQGFAPEIKNVEPIPPKRATATWKKGIRVASAVRSLKVDHPREPSWEAGLAGNEFRAERGSDELIGLEGLI
jgi:hypothetical protein